MEAVEIEDDFLDAAPYRLRVAPVDDGLPYLDEKTGPWERELRVAIEIARREPYCERVTYNSGVPKRQLSKAGYVRKGHPPAVLQELAKRKISLGQGQ